MVLVLLAAGFKPILSVDAARDCRLQSRETMFVDKLAPNVNAINFGIDAITCALKCTLIV
jgi:hypothetical protein